MKEIFKEICKYTDIPEGRKGIKFIVDDLEIVLFKIDKSVYAIENTCPHNHTHLLHEGFVDNELNIECPVHGWKFNLITGKQPADLQSTSAKLQLFEVKVENNTVYVQIKENKIKFRF